VANHAFQNTLSDIAARTMMPASADRQATLSQQFHNDILHLIEVDDITPTPRLSRQTSAEFVSSFQRSDSLLKLGAEGYIQAVKRLLRVDEKRAVAVAYKNLSFMGHPVADAEEKKPISTVGTATFTMMCGLVVVLRDKLLKPRGKPVPVLERASGIIRPGRTTLVLGPPGAGKSVFLKTLSGRMLHSPGGEQKGQIKYNGKDLAQLSNLAAWAAYVGQSDEHQRLMTVRETLQFAWQCRREALFHDSQAMKDLRDRFGEAGVERLGNFRDVEVDLCLAILGLTGCADTIIGDDTLKGVSGGEKRRVTLGEMLVTGAQLLCADSVSTGLDAAATYDITAFLSRAAKVLNQTIVVALLQPPPDVIDLFDDLICLAQGRVIYHGERGKVLEYFESLGFKCPVDKDLGDFLQELPTTEGRKFVDQAKVNSRLAAPPCSRRCRTSPSMTLICSPCRP
jgi:ABC-type multidrug transport system ATPase subunit